ncbi:MAG: phosphotransferase [Thaumarchaeota archaeon]|nr:phosphotransferase [Candidatus Calditenuaceae archaeon]MDW8186542.1 phosphotransferase [Nitrososphaerota archaeon]
MLFAIRYPVMTREGSSEETLEVVGSRGSVVKTSLSGGERHVVVDMTTFSSDVKRGAYGEVLASRLLTPFRFEGDQKALQELLGVYVRRAIESSNDDLRKDYGKMAEKVLIDPSYFVLRKVRGLVALYPPLWRIFWWASRGSLDVSLLNKVVENVRPVLEELVRSRALSLDHHSGLYRLASSREESKELRNSKGGALIKRVESLMLPGKLGIGLPRLVLEEVLMGGWETLSPPDPEEALLIPTESGPQPLSFEGDILEIVCKLYGSDPSSVRVSRAGRLFNSTYLVEVPLDGEVKRLFLKRYLAWSDVKWVATKLWSFPLRNFHISPTVRLSNELFFISFLRERGFRTPNVYGVSWRRRVLLEGAIQGSSLREIWTWDESDVDYLEDVTTKCGESIAKAHACGVTLGDCKPDNVMVDQRGTLWLVDLEQASLGGDRAWDIAEFVLFMARYLDLKRSKEFARYFGEGYLRFGNIRDVELALDPKYVLVMMPWSPVWTQVAALEGLREALRG